MNTAKKTLGLNVVQIIIGVIPLLLFAVILLYIFTKQQEKIIHQLLLESANHASHSVDRAIGEQIGLLYGLAAARSLDEGNFDSFRVNAARVMHAHPEWRTVIVTDESKPVFNIRFPSGQAITPLRDPHSLQRVWTTKQPYVGDLSNGFVAIRAPVIRDEQIRYTLVVPVEPHFFLDAVALSSSNRSWGLIIVGSDGRVIAASPSAVAASGEKLPTTYLSSDATPKILDNIVYSPPRAIKTGGWQLILFAPQSAIEAPFAKTRRLVFFGGFMAAAMTIVLVLALGTAWAARREAMGLHREIARRLAIEEDLRQAQLSLKEAQRLAEIGNWSWDIPADRHFWSEEIYHIYGRDPHLPPATYPEVKSYFTEESWERLRAAVDQCLRHRTAYQCDAEVLRSDGSRRWILARGEAVGEQDGRPRLLRGTVQDITASKRAEEILRDSELRYRSLFEQNLDAIAIIEGLPPRFTFVNPAFVELFGYSQAEVQAMQGEQIWCLVHPEDIDVVRERLADRFEGRSKSVRYEFRIVRKDGTIRIVEASGTMISIHGRAVNQSIYRDLTQQKEAEKERALLQEQFHQSQKLESVGRLAGGVAHDFNNILTVILGYAEMAMSQLESGEPLYEDLATIHDAAKRSSEIVRQLLAFSRKQVVQPVTLSLNERIESMLKMLQRLLGENIRLEWRPTPQLPPITIDPSQADQILANLCVNARDAINDTGVITLATSLVDLDPDYSAVHLAVQPGKYVLLTVSDTGIGMEKEVIDKIFEPFFSTKGSLGTGLGLATVYGIVKQNQGHINVYSEPGNGSVFKIYLPVSSEAPTLVDSVMQEPALGAGETILFVDDDQTLLKLHGKVLEQLGYQVLVAGSASTAIELAHQHSGKIDLLITDVIMPEMNGKELAERIVSQFPKTKVLYLSGYTADVIAHHGILDEGLCFLQKPFSRQSLSTKIRSTLESR